MRNCFQIKTIFYLNFALILASFSANAKNRFIELKGHGGAVYSPSFIPDRDELITGSKDGTVKTWDTAKGIELKTFRNHSGPVYSAQSHPFYPAFMWTILTSSQDGATYMWSNHRKNFYLLHGFSEDEFKTSLNEDRTKMLMIQNGKLMILDPSSGKVLTTLQDAPFKAVSAAFVTEERRVSGIGFGVGSMSGYTQKAEHIVSCNQQGGIAIWQLRAWKDSNLEKDGSYAEKINPNADNQFDHNSLRWGSRIFLENGNLGYRSIVTPDDDLVSIPSQPKTSVGVLSLMTTFATCDDHGTLELFKDLKPFFKKEPTPELPVVYSAQFSPDGKKVVRGLGNGLTQILDVNTGKRMQVLKGHTDSVYSTQFSRDGRWIVTASADHSTRFWNVETGQEQFRLRGHSGPVYSAQYSPDSSRVVTASQDHSARIWDVGTGKELLILRGHTHEVSSASFSPNGQYVITGSYDNSAKLWDAKTGEELQTFRGHLSGISGVAFSPDGLSFATTSYDGTARIWWIKPEYSFELEDLAETLRLLQFKAYRASGQDKFFSELKIIVEKEAKTHDQQLVLFLVLQAYLQDPAIAAIQEIKDEVIPSLGKSALNLAKQEGIATFADLKPSPQVLHTLVSILRATLLAMQNSNGVTSTEQMQLKQALRVLVDAQNKISTIRPNQMRTLLEAITNLRQTLETNKLQIIDTWAQAGDLRSAYASLFNLLINYLKTI